MRELVAVIAAVLEGQIAEEDRDLLHDDVAKFKVTMFPEILTTWTADEEQANIAPIAAALSSRFQEDVASISTLLDPDDPPSEQGLAPTISDLKSSVSATEAQLNDSRLQLAAQAATVHSLNRQVIQHSISILEQTIHGTVARGSKTKAEYLATVAEGMSKKLSLQQKQMDSQLYSPEAREALKMKANELDGSLQATKRKIREAEEKLDGYRSVGGMEGVAREYAEVLAETERVRREIERLRDGGHAST